MQIYHEHISLHENMKYVLRQETMLCRTYSNHSSLEIS